LLGDSTWRPTQLSHLSADQQAAATGKWTHLHGSNFMRVGGGSAALLFPPFHVLLQGDNVSAACKASFYRGLLFSLL
jgi:hypothetical protein